MANGRKKRRVLSYLLSYDTNLIVAVIFLIVFGLIMLYSASYYTASMRESFHYDPAYFLKSQLKYSILGLGLMLITANINYRTWRYFAVIGLIRSSDFAAFSAGAGRHRKGSDPVASDPRAWTVPGGGAGEGGHDYFFGSPDL